MSNFDEKTVERIKKLEREVERLRVKESPGAWQNWTPTPSWAGGTAPTSLTINSARYSQVGKIVYFFVKFDVTVGSGTATVMYCDLPVTNAGATGAVSASSNVLGGWVANSCFLDGNITLVFSSGMTSDGSIFLSGFYEIV